MRLKTRSRLALIFTSILLGQEDGLSVNEERDLTSLLYFSLPEAIRFNACL